MLYLLNEFIQEMGMGYDFNWCNPHEPTSEFYPLARLVFGSETSKIAKQLNAHLMHKTAGIFSDGYRSIDTKNHSLLMRLSAVGQVLETAPALVFFEGVNDKNSWVQAGFQAQYLTGYWQQFKLGSCALAYRPSIDSVYALALGAIASEEELLAETKPPVKACLDEQLTTALSQLESEGRLPDAYIIVNHLPLTDEGAIDWKSLPIPDIALAEWEYQAPESELESLFCEVWQEVLGIKQIGILDDFFRLGGHSISCMQVTAKLRQLGIDCSVKSIFEHRCIKGVLPYTQAIVINEIEEQQIDEADNFIYADLSSELIEFLQQSYE